MFAYPKIIPVIILFACINIIACRSPEKIDLGEVPIFSGAAPTQPSDSSLVNDTETQLITNNESAPSSESADSNLTNGTNAQSITDNGNTSLLTTGVTEQTAESSQNEVKSGNDNLPTTAYTKTVQSLSHVPHPTTAP